MSEPTDPTVPFERDQPLDPAEPPGPEERSAGRQRTALIVGGVIAAVLVIGGLLWFLSDDDDSDVATDATTTAVETTTSTTEQATTTEQPTTTQQTTTTIDQVVPLDPDDAAFVLWPAPDGDLRYDDAVAAATAFATDLVGFTDPIVGGLQQGDARSGEVEVRAVEDGAVTTVLVRQYGTDDSWWVIGAVTPDIEVDAPLPQSAIDDPLQVSGRARAFEGTVQVAVVADGSTDPIGTGFVTGSGSGELGPFQGEIRWTNPGGGWGAVLFFTESAQDGSVWQVSATRVGFIGGD
jgi:hypothetical protein